MSFVSLRTLTVRPSALLVAALHAALILGLLSALNIRMPTASDGVLEIVVTPPLPPPDPTPPAPDNRAIVTPNASPKVPLPALPTVDAPTETSDASVTSDSGQSAAAIPTALTWAHAEIRYRTDVEYPRLARYLDEQGVVMLSVRIGVDGRPRQILIDVTSGHSRLDQAALAAVAHWKFKPVTRDGVAVEAWTRLPISFRLQD